LPARTFVDGALAFIGLYSLVVWIVVWDRALLGSRVPRGEVAYGRVWN